MQNIKLGVAWLSAFWHIQCMYQNPSCVLLSHVTHNAFRQNALRPTMLHVILNTSLALKNWFGVDLHLIIVLDHLAKIKIKNPPIAYYGPWVSVVYQIYDPQGPHATNSVITNSRLSCCACFYCNLQWKPAGLAKSKHLQTLASITTHLSTDKINAHKKLLPLGENCACATSPSR